MNELPGGALAKRPLHFIWIADCSSSMAGQGKIQSLNQAIREALPHMKKVASDNPYAEVLVRAITFSSGAEWHVAKPTPLDDFTWTDLNAAGVTDMGRALSMVADVLKIPPMESRALPPVLVLVTDGMPTDDYKSGLKKLLDLPWGKKAVRIAIAIGDEIEQGVLKQFIDHVEIEPLVASNADHLVKFIRWASTAVLQAASAPRSQQEGEDSPLPPLPEVPTTNPVDQTVW